MNVLLVDQYKNIRNNLIMYLELNDRYDEVFVAGNVEETINILDSKIIDVIVFDIQLKERNGFDIVSYVNELPKRPTLIMLTNFTQSEYKKAYEQIGIDYVFDKTKDLKTIKRFLAEIAGNKKAK